MPGLSFLAKKSWHTSNLKNVEKVWLAEQKSEQENKRLEELQKQLQEERQIQELRQLQATNGQKVQSVDTSMDWMYEGPAAAQAAQKQKDAEAYLLGKIYKPQEAKTFDLSVPVNLSSHDDKSWMNKISNKNDMFSRKHEDPMMAIKQEEKKQRDTVVSNPVKMEKIRLKISKELQEYEAQKQMKHRAKKEKKELKKKKKEMKRLKKQAKKDGKSADKTKEEVKENTKSRKRGHSSGSEEESDDDGDSGKSSDETSSTNSAYSHNSQQVLKRRRTLSPDKSRDAALSRRRSVSVEDHRRNPNNNAEKDRPSARYESNNRERSNSPTPRDRQYRSDSRRRDDSRSRNYDRDRDYYSRNNNNNHNNNSYDSNHPYPPRDHHSRDRNTRSDDRSERNRKRSVSHDRNIQNRSDRQLPPKDAKKPQYEDTHKPANDHTKSDRDKTRRSHSASSASSSSSSPRRQYGLLNSNKQKDDAGKKKDYLGPNPALIKQKEEETQRLKQAKFNRSRGSVSVLTEEEKERRLQAMQQDAVLLDAKRIKQSEDHLKQLEQQGQEGNEDAKGGSFLQSMRQNVFQEGLDKGLKDRLDQNRYYQQRSHELEGSASNFLQK